MCSVGNARQSVGIVRRIFVRRESIGTEILFLIWLLPCNTKN